MKSLVDWRDHGKHVINLSKWSCAGLRICFEKKVIAVSDEAIGRG